MAELLTDNEELEFQRKVKVKRRFRGLLIVVNMLLACYLIFAAGTAIVEIINNKKESKDTVLLCEKSEGASLKLYEDFVKDSIQGDFAIYGEDLHLRQSNFNVAKSDTFSDVQLVNVCSKSGAILSSYRYSTHGEENELNHGISLFNDTTGKALENGYYIFYSNYVDVNNRGKVVRVNSEQKIEHTFFSTPDQDGRRVKATIYSYPKNKALVLKIEQVNKLSDEFYDVVLFGNPSKTAPLLHKLEERNLKVKVLDSLLYTYADVYRVKASYAFVVVEGDAEKIEVSSKVDLAFEKSDDSVFLELGAYAFFSGSLAEFFTEHTPGKMTFYVAFAGDMSPGLVDSLVDFGNN